MKRFIQVIILVLIAQYVNAQSGTDTLHYRKIYYFGGTGLSFPIGETNNVLGSRLFSSSLGLDISLKNPTYFLHPTWYNMNYNYDQLVEDPEYNRILKNAKTFIYTLSLAGGVRKQFRRLNAYTYLGPAVGLDVEPRSNDNGNGLAEMEYKFFFSPGMMLGTGVDYKFKGFFLGLELSYLGHFRKIQDQRINALTLMVGLKSDITNLGDKVKNVISR